MTRRLLTMIGLAVLPLTAARSGASVPVGLSGESLRTAPVSEAPSEGTLTRAWSRTDQLRSADAPGFVAASSFGLGPDPVEHVATIQVAARSPRRSALDLLPLSRAPPA